jgi:predicted phage tail protein
MITVKEVPNRFVAEGRKEIELDYSRDFSVEDYLKQSGFDYKEKVIIISGKRVENLKLRIDNQDEIIVTPSIDWPVVVFIGHAIWAAIVAHPFIAAAFALSMAYSIYTSVTMAKPSMPNFGTSAGSDSLDANSPTYGWDGVKSTQEVGAPVRMLYGEHRVGINYINAFLKTDGTTDKQYLYLLGGICEGEIESIGSVEINDNPSGNFSEIIITYKYGTNTQTVIPNFEDSHNLYDVNVILNNPADEHTYTTIDSDVEAFEVLLQLPGGLYMTDSGGLYEMFVQFSVSYRLHSGGGWTEINYTYWGKTRTTLRRSVRIDGLSPAQYDIRVKRYSQASWISTSQGQCDMTWTQIDEIKTDDFAYPNTALIGIEALATDQLSGGLPNITVLVKGKKVNIPKVMNGAAEVAWEDYYWDGTYYRLLVGDTQLTWDGSTYVDRYCANPVWCLKDLLINTRYGLGEYIESTDLDTSLFLEMSRYCDEKVPDGKGGYEKRFRFDVVIDSRLRALDLIMQLCSVFRGMAFYSEGKIKLQIEKSGTPVQLFNMGNIIQSSFAQNWKSKKQIYNVIEMQFMDKDLNYRQDTIEYIDETALTAGDELRKQSLRYYATRISQTLREARYTQKVAKYINRSISFKAGIDAIACQPGDIISVSHDVPQWGWGGRVLAGSTTTSIIIDQDIAIENGKSYRLQIQFPDDTIEEKVVTNSPTEGTHTITVSSAFSQTPSAYDKYCFGENNAVKKDFRVLSIKLNNNSEVEVFAVEYRSEIYDDSAVTIPDNKYSALTVEPPSVLNLNITERLSKLKDGTIENAIDVWFDRPTATNYLKRWQKAKIYTSENNVSWRYRGETADRHFEIVGDIADGITYYVKAVSVTTDGDTEDFDDAPSVSITIIGKSAAPSNVSSFLVNQNRDRLLFTWTEISDLDVWGYEIRWGSTWDSGAVVAFIQGNKYQTTNLRTGSGQSYWIKALDTSGNYSETALEAEITIDNIPFRNIIESYSEQTAWSGNKVDTEVDGNNLQIVTGEVTGTYTTPERDIGYVATFYVGIEAITSISQGRRFDDDGTTKFNSSATARFSGEETPGAATFEIRTSEDDITWTDWKAWQAGDYKCRYFQLRMTLTRQNVADDLECSQFNYYADLPDIDEIQDGEVTVAGDGDDISFTKTFHENPALNVTILTGDGVYWKASSLDTDSVNIKLYNISGTAVTGTFRIHIHGV